MKIVRAGTLIDGTGAPAVRDAVIQIDNGRIEAVTTAGPSGSWPAGTDVIDASNLTVLPGLIDCHDHLAFHGYELAKRWGLDEPRSTWHLRTAAVARQILESGYTAIRDAGGLDAGFRVAIQEGLIPGPRLVLSLAIISPTGGLGDRVSPSGHRAPAESDPCLPSSVADGVEAVRTTVRAMVRAGADVIKCATTGGASSRAGHGPKDSEYTLEEMKALVDEAHALGRRVMCHALEPALLASAGMTPMQALQAATGRAAECLGLEAEIGTIEKGKWADLIFVEGDPLRDITVLQDKRRIKRVIKGGVSVRG